MTPPRLSAPLERWRAEGVEFATAFGVVFTRRAGSGRPLLLLHGYPTCSYDWHAVLPLLGDRTVLALDFLGFGLSAKPAGHDYSLFEQADLVEAVVAGAELAGPVDVLAHDMGTSVTTELMARELEGALSFRLGSVVLSNGSVILERASLRPIQKVLRSRAGALVSALSNKVLFRQQLGAVFSADHPLPRAEADLLWELMTVHGGHRKLHRLTSYLSERVTHADRWHGAVRDWAGDLGLLWGEQDPVATLAVLDGLVALRPAATVVTLPGLGHYPQLEDPERFCAGLRQLL